MPRPKRRWAVKRTVLIISLVGWSSGLLAQSTNLPTYHGPHRVFERTEFGATVSFPGNNVLAFEGQYRFGYRQFDLGFRGGLILDDFRNDTYLALGGEARQRIISHSEQIPFDGAVVFGAGTWLGDDRDELFAPVGISLGRRFELEESEVVLVPYLQPTALVVVGDDNDLGLSLGVGADLRLRPFFDLRISAGFGDPSGLAVSVVWIR